MIVWLASYPRSGNTFTRILFNHCLGIQSYSVHEGDNVDFKEISDVVGHDSTVIDEEFIDHARISKEIYVIKTHLPPAGDDKTIYIVRDGRSSVISYYHYAKSHGHAYPIENFIEGIGDSYSWSEHFHIWNPINRKNTLLLRYENLIENPLGTLENISQFLGTPIISRDIISFNSLKESAPSFFRSGSDENNKLELTGILLGYFYLLHGGVMIKLGYADIDDVFNCIKQHFAKNIYGVKTLDSVVHLTNALQIVENNSQARYENVFALLSKLLSSQP